MARTLFILMLFVLTVGGLLLFKPERQHAIVDYSEPESLEERKNVTVKMAQYLEKNPEIVKQDVFTSLPSENKPQENNQPSPQTATQDSVAPSREYRVNFQNTETNFKSSDEMNEWIYGNVQRDPIAFIKSLKAEEYHAEIYLEALKRVSEMDKKPEVTAELKETYLEEARKLLKNKDGYHQQMGARALQQYLNLEKDLDLGKKTADELLNSVNQ